MQTLETEHKSIGAKGDEECINFRPSPNFKHMRKYCKPKFKESLSDLSSSEDLSPMIESEEPEKVPPKTAMIQPPLPPNPPPDTPFVKQEIEDMEYGNETEEVKPSSEDAKGEANNEPEGEVKIEMCREWARGECNRGDKCFYLHEIIHSQLPEVYTFCKNFQNSRCFYPNCKFVHATVFEKESYYRTGYLPSHVFAHLDKNKVTQTHLPPVQKGTSKRPVVFNNPPPSVIQPSAGSTLPVARCAPFPMPPSVAQTPVPTFESRNNNDVPSTSRAVTSPVKRDRSEIDDFTSITPELEYSEPLTKKCKFCEVNEFRLQCNKIKVEKMMKASMEMTKKTELLVKKNDKLYTILVSLLKSSNGKENANNVLNAIPAFNMRNEKENTMMEQIKMIFSSNNRISKTTEEKNLVSGNISNITSSSNFSTVLAKLLLNTSDQSLTSDTS